MNTDPHVNTPTFRRNEQVFLRPDEPRHSGDASELTHPMLSAKAFFSTPASQLTAQMEQDFFTSLMMRNKTYKTTFRGRFADINASLAQRVCHSATQTLRVLDIGISSGVSTLELYDDLRTTGAEVTMVGTDILLDAFLVRVGPRCYALMTPDGFPLRFDLPWGTMKPWVTRDDYRTGRFILRKAANVMLTRRARRIVGKRTDDRVSAVKLVTPRLLENHDVTLMTDDLSRYNGALAGKFDFIRAANILNNGYFSAGTLTLMVANIRRYLSGTNSQLFVVRTHQDNTNHGTLFRLNASGRFEATWRVGAGSEIEDVVLQAEGLAE